jgi:hypothetical protein
MRFALFCFFPALAQAAITGTVMNRTHNTPQPDVRVLMTQFSGGTMMPAGSARTDAQGRFTLDTEAQGAHLFQAFYQGVTYSLSVPSGSSNTAIEIPVWEASPKGVAAKADQHMVLLETDGQELVVNETIIYKNDGTTTWSDPADGTIRFYVPEAAQKQLRVRATSPGGLPIERDPQKTAEKNVYTVDFPVKPGETRFDVSYKMAVTAPVTFSSRVMHEEGKVRLVVPQGITLEAKMIKELGREPTSQAAIYEVEGRAYAVTISGKGALRNLESTERSEDDSPRIEQIQPRIYDRLPWILGLSLGLLAVGFWSLYQRDRSQGPAPPATGNKRKA